MGTSKHRVGGGWRIGGILAAGLVAIELGGCAPRGPDLDDYRRERGGVAQDGPLLLRSGFSAWADRGVGRGPMDTWSEPRQDET